MCICVLGGGARLWLWKSVIVCFCGFVVLVLTLRRQTFKYKMLLNRASESAAAVSAPTPAATPAPTPGISSRSVGNDAARGVFRRGCRQLLGPVGRAPLSLRAVGAIRRTRRSRASLLPASPGSHLIEIGICIQSASREEGGRADGSRCPNGVGWS